MTKLRIIGPAGRKIYQYGHADAYVGGTPKLGYSLIVSVGGALAKTLPKIYKTKPEAIKAAKIWVKKHG